MPNCGLFIRAMMNSTDEAQFKPKITAIVPDQQMVVASQNKIKGVRTKLNKITNQILESESADEKLICPERTLKEMAQVEGLEPPTG